MTLSRRGVSEGIGGENRGGLGTFFFFAIEHRNVITAVL